MAKLPSLERNSIPTRQSNNINIPKIEYKLELIVDRFKDNIKNIKEKFSITKNLQENHLDGAEDIWRAQIVFLDSALDFYIHEITKYGIVKIFNKDWAETQEYKNIKVYLKFAIELANNPGSSSKLLDELDDIYNYFCFMSLGKLKKQLQLIGINCQLTKHEEYLINDLYKRRNQIAHQADYPKGSFIKENIEEQFVADYINNIEKIVMEKIHIAILEKNKK